MNDHDSLPAATVSLKDKDSLNRPSITVETHDFIRIDKSEKLEKLGIIDYAGEIAGEKDNSRDMLLQREKNPYAPSAPPEEIDMIQEAYNPYFRMPEREMDSNHHSYRHEETMNEPEPKMKEILESELEKYFSLKKSQMIGSDKSIQPNSLKSLRNKLFKKPLKNREGDNIASFSQKNERKAATALPSTQENSQYTVKELTRKSYPSSKKPKSQAKEVVSIYR